MARKITEIINDGKETMFSFEVTPGITREDLENMEFEPLFFSITWHAQVHQNKNYEIAPLKLAYYLRNKNKNVLLHISCANMRKDYANMLLKILQEKDICNVFIILGENFDPNKSDFKNSQEFIVYIRQRYRNYFCIGVAGFPDRDDKILHLKEKVDSGADFIITQAFFEHSIYIKYIMRCKEVGIHVPIIPGMFPFETLYELEGFVKLCKVPVTSDLIETISKKSGIEVVAKLISDIIEHFQVKYFHLFTLNKMQRATKVIDKVKLLNTLIG